MEFLITYKWLILISFETFAWLATFYMFYARYWLQSHAQFLIALTLAGLTGYVPHITLGVLDYINTGKISFFIISIITLLIIGATLGKKYIIKIDQSIHQWAIQKKKKGAEGRF
ncbi:hypothetical protein M3172_13420 [Mesobacillus subterraneus]|uniref:hypothetical protein n=1 Tax=Mesobacillus subterraneus TaxID=285983 RepID=UPI00203AC62A|nr:hypothetical protein [Mesobacillus subterraneus]MCM3574190.1 hypothetical protein [Mesobacillus subterraneus]